MDKPENNSDVKKTKLITFLNKRDNSKMKLGILCTVNNEYMYENSRSQFHIFCFVVRKV